jgi:hypothetical protein
MRDKSGMVESEALALHTKRKETSVTLLVIPAWIAGIQKPGMATLIHPCNLDPGIPCRGDGMTFLS